MTTQSSFKSEYVKSTESENSKIRVSFRFPTLMLLKLLLFSLLGQPQVVWHTLTDFEIELLSRYIVKWRLVKNLRAHQRHAKDQ